MLSWPTLRKPQYRAIHARMGESGDGHPESLEHAHELAESVKVEVSRSGVTRFPSNASRKGIE